MRYFVFYIVWIVPQPRNTWESLVQSKGDIFLLWHGGVEGKLNFFCLWFQGYWELQQRLLSAVLAVMGSRRWRVPGSCWGLLLGRGLLGSHCALSGAFPEYWSCWVSTQLFWGKGLLLNSGRSSTALVWPHSQRGLCVCAVVVSVSRKGLCPLSPIVAGGGKQQ